VPVVAIALGSNLGDRSAHITAAIEQLTASLANARTSSVIETAPVDVPDRQPPYLNAVVVGDTDRSAEELLQELHRIERLAGRRRPAPRAPRTLDLDLILYGEAVIDRSDLVVPHPRFRSRRFVLEPLVEIAPDLRDPVTGLTIRDLLTKKGDAA